MGAGDEPPHGAPGAGDVRELTMGTNVPARIATGPADQPGNLHRLETDMDKTKKRLDRAKRHARRLAMQAIDGAGTRRDVAEAIGRDESTVSHEATSRANPVLHEALAMELMLDAHPATTGESIRRAFYEARELHPILLADDETLIDRAMYLIVQEDCLERDENRAAKTRDGYSEALRAEGHAQIELAAIIDELELRGICVWDELRRRAS